MKEYSNTLITRMRFLIPIIILFIFNSCTKSQDNHNSQKQSGVTSESSSNDTLKNKSKKRQDYVIKYNHRIDLGLKELAENGVFSLIHDSLITNIEVKHKNYFYSKPEYKLLSYDSGNLFNNGNTDYVFIIYDEINNKIYIMFYNEQNESYPELYRHFIVENKIDTTNYCFKGNKKLDVYLAEEFLYMKDSYIKNPESYFQITICDISSFSDNSYIVFDRGCKSIDTWANDSYSILCIASDFVYNSWVCLKYDEISKSFNLIYYQAFAD